MIERISEKMAAAADIADKGSQSNKTHEGAGPVDDAISRLNDKDVMRCAIYSYACKIYADKGLENPETAVETHRQFAELLGVAPEQVAQAFKGRPWSLAVNFAAAGPKDFESHLGQLTHKTNIQTLALGVPVTLAFGALSYGGWNGPTCSHLLCYLGPAAFTALTGATLFLMGNVAADLGGPKDRLDERQLEYRKQIKAFVSQFEASKKEAEQDNAPDVCAYCGGASTGGRCGSCGAPPVRQRPRFKTAELNEHALRFKSLAPHAQTAGTKEPEAGDRAYTYAF